MDRNSRHADPVNSVLLKKIDIGLSKDADTARIVIARAVFHGLIFDFNSVVLNYPVLKKSYS